MIAAMATFLDLCLIHALICLQIGHDLILLPRFQIFRYDNGKWTIKELLQHIIDAERVLSYRALRFSRNDPSDLQGFDEDWYVGNSNGNERNFEDILEEFTYLRKANISLFNSFTSEMMLMLGTANGSIMSVRALGFIIVGHQMHHLKIIKEKYL